MIPRAVLDRSVGTLAPILDANLTKAHGERTGFLLFIFDFADRGHLAYATNAELSSLIAAVEEVLTNLKAGLTTDPRVRTGEVRP